MTQSAAPERTATPRDSVEVTSYAELREAWRCPHLTAEISGPGDQYFHSGTVMRLDGADHALRRRALGQLLRKRGHKIFRDRWLIPMADAELANILENRDEDGYARVDLLGWARLVNQQLAAAITGFDEGTTRDGAARLFDLMETVMAGRPSSIAVILGEYDENSDAAKRAVQAKDEIIDRYYRPSIARREQLVTRVVAGELPESELPQDLLTLIALAADPAFADPELAQREAIFMLAAAVHTTSSAMSWVLRETFEWLQKNPGHEHRLHDEQFLARASAEAMRLHPVVPGLTRGATEAVRLQGGTEVPEDAIAILKSGLGNVDTSVYGENALEFDPDREVPPGVNRYGFAFGAGTHMCYGMPIVLGADGVDGSLVHLLKRVLDAGVRPDPERPSSPLAGTRGVFDYSDKAYYVIFPPRPSRS